MKIKQHFIDHQELYCGIGVGFGIAAISYAIMRGRYAVLLRGTDGLKTADASVTVRPLSFLSLQKNEIVTTIHSGTRGHPGFMTKNLEYGLIFNTQADAARAFNISPANLSSHLNGHFPEVSGLHFERVAV